MRKSNKLLECSICKNLIADKPSGDGFLFASDAGRQTVQDENLSAQIGSARLSFAKPEYMEKYLDITPGSLSILGLMNDREKKSVF